FGADKASKALFPESLNIGEWVYLRAQKRGLLVRPIVHLNVMSPPLILTREQVDTVVRVLRESIEETVEDLVRLGDHLPDAPGEEARAQRLVAGGEALGGEDDVRLYAEHRLA
ncbi:hypothetical protein ACV33P_30970, partial [Pseudomonas aeruginosa]